MNGVVVKVKTKKENENALLDRVLKLRLVVLGLGFALALDVTHHALPCRGCDDAAVRTSRSCGHAAHVDELAVL